MFAHEYLNLDKIKRLMLYWFINADERCES